jgi:hypothetical protein
MLVLAIAVCGKGETITWGRSFPKDSIKTDSKSLLNLMLSAKNIPAIYLNEDLFVEEIVVIENDIVVASHRDLLHCNVYASVGLLAN